jgi:hypothetical protein
VLGADVVVLERPCLFLGEDDDLAGPLGEPLKHAHMIPLAAAGSAPSTTGLLPRRVRWTLNHSAESGYTITF